MDNTTRIHIFVLLICCVNPMKCAGYVKTNQLKMHHTSASECVVSILAWVVFVVYTGDAVAYTGVSYVDPP